MNTLQDLLDRLRLQPAVLVSVESSEGSVPRESGAWMAVFPNVVLGTVGGGHLEHVAIERAKAQLLALAQTLPFTERHALGPSLGQCCGGVVWLRYEALAAGDAAALAARLREPHKPVALFGGGHVGCAIVQALQPLPFDVRWIDSREAVFAPHLAHTVHCEHSQPVQAAVPALAPGSRVLIMSFSHAEDFDVLLACLQRQRERADLPYIGLIGSRTKWAAMRHRLEARGLGPADFAQVTSPIGVPGISGKQPAVIAAAVVAQLLQVQG